jgi:signal transduction histidine kinase
MHRLAFQIYLTVVAILVLFAVLISVAWVVHPRAPWERQFEERLGATVGELLPGSDRPIRELQAALERHAARLRVDLAVYGPDGSRIAAAGEGLPDHRPARYRSWLRHHGRATTVTLPLPGDRTLVARHSHPRGGAVAFLLVLVLLAVAVALGSWPLVRRLTRRLERLRRRVEDLGGGDLKARAPVEGKDEVAHLALSFNRAADRIERLVGVQRRVLAHASHELRSPLARLRVSLEMTPATNEQKTMVARDLAELDGIIDEILEASRLETAERLARVECVDLLALLAEEGARTGAEVGGEAVEIQGDPRLLRRLVRNLLENARRHGEDGPVEARVDHGEGTGVRVRVLDRGPGIPPEDRERVFEPFYRPAGRAETGEGHGLGLSLVRQIARAHGGEARCLPREGGGTLFEVELGESARPGEKEREDIA